MSQKVEKRKEHREWLLHAEEAVEGPFAMELKYWMQHWGFSRNPAVGDDVLADMVAIRGAGPE